MHGKAFARTIRSQHREGNGLSSGRDRRCSRIRINGWISVDENRTQILMRSSNDGFVRVPSGLSPIRKLLLSTHCEDQTLSDRQHRTIRNWETRFSPVGTSRLLGQMASCCSRKTCGNLTWRSWELTEHDFSEVQSHTLYQGVDQLAYIAAVGVRLGMHYFWIGRTLPLFVAAPTLSVS